MEGILITLSLFAAIFGIFYLHYTTRNKERMALIEKGGDASMFFSKRKRRTAPVWKVLTLNLAVLLMGELLINKIQIIKATICSIFKK